MSLKRFRLVLILVLLAAYLIAEHGFMLVRIPPTSQYGAPLAEITVLAFLGSFIWDVSKLRGFAQVAPLTALLIWWGLGFARAAEGFYYHGIWAIRDASHLIDSLFIWIGFVIAATPGFMGSFSRWLRAICNLGIVYSLLFPLRESLAQWSPHLSAPGGYVAPLLFNYAPGGLMLLTGAARLLLAGVRMLMLPPSVVPGLLIAFAIAAFQARTAYLQVLALILLLACFNIRAALQTVMGLMIGTSIVLLFIAAGLDLNSRLGEPFSLEFLANHFAAIWAEEGAGAVRSSSSGTIQRLQWWTKIWNDVTSDYLNILFGLGYGIPLTDFRYYNNVLVREPHNSTISVFARLGVLGLMAFLWIHIVLTRTLFRSVRRLTAIGDEAWRINLMVMGTFIFLVWVYTLGEDGLEKPFVAIPFYFFLGVILRVAYALQVADSGRRVWVRAPLQGRRPADLRGAFG